MSTARPAGPAMPAITYNFAYLDEQTKKMIRRAILKAIAIPGHQVPFAAREMPMPYGWGTGGVQVTAAILGADDVLKVIDQGSDDTTNAVAIRSFFAATAGIATTTRTREASIIQTRHRIPEAPLVAGQVIVYQVPIPEPLRFLEPRETETRRMHGLADYGLMHVKLYEDIARHGHIATTYAYPVMVAGRYLTDPSPIPKFDNPKMDGSPALQLFGAGREKRIYAIPPHTRVVSLDFDDHPFRVQHFAQPCALCAAEDVYLDEVILDDAGGRMFVCSDTDHCGDRQAAGHAGTMRAPYAADPGPARGTAGGAGRNGEPTPMQRPLPPAGDHEAAAGGTGHNAEAAPTQRPLPRPGDDDVAPAANPAPTAAAGGAERNAEAGPTPAVPHGNVDAALAQPPRSPAGTGRDGGLSQAPPAPGISGAAPLAPCPSAQAGAGEAAPAPSPASTAAAGGEP